MTPCSYLFSIFMQHAPFSSYSFHKAVNRCTTKEEGHPSRMNKQTKNAQGKMKNMKIIIDACIVNKKKQPLLMLDSSNIYVNAIGNASSVRTKQLRLY